MLAIAWQYLTGRAVATDVFHRGKAEWPPHPDRVFMALVAAWGETGRTEEGRKALEWLEGQGVPSLWFPWEPPLGYAGDVFVPVNDAKDLGHLPQNPTRKARSFPSVLPGEQTCGLIFPDSDPGPHRTALETLCQNVTRIGHSRSLVRVWIEPDPPAPTLIPRRDAGVTHHLRVFYPGRFVELEADFQAMTTVVPEPPRRKTRGRKPDPEPPPTRQYEMGEVVSYGRPGQQELPRGDFSERLLILQRFEGVRAGLPRSLAWLEVLRNTLLKAAGDGEWFSLVSGHDALGGPLRAPHLALVPLVDVGHPYADGHLMGFGLVFPKDLPREKEVGFLFQVWPKVFQGEPSRLRLFAGERGEMVLVQESRPVPPRALRSETWTRPAARWVSVTPVVLDRQPPRRHEDQDAWAADQIRQACTRQGLPDPTEVRVSPVSELLGVPPSRAFPPCPRRSDGGRRWHIHASVVFPTPIGGPLLLGAGRYRGYGLFQPQGG